MIYFPAVNHKTRLRLQAAFVTIAYVALTSALCIHHVMWRDELEPWLLARDSVSLPELVANLRTNGHPLLWYFCLYALNALTHLPWIMQWMHVMLAATSVFLIVRF